MSPLNLQVKVNTQDPTHGAAVSAWMKHLYLGNQALQGLMEDGEGGCRLYVTASSVRCGAFRKPSFTRLVIFHHPSLFRCLCLSPFPSLHSVQGLFWCQENTHKQAATCTLTTSTHGHEDRHRNRPRRRRDTCTGRTHNQKVSNGRSYLISVVIALSSTAGPHGWIHSHNPRKKVQFILTRRSGINQSLELTFKLKIITENHIMLFTETADGVEDLDVTDEAFHAAFYLQRSTEEDEGQKFIWGMGAFFLRIL